MNRETWLNRAADLMAPKFASLGHALPPFRVSIGFPSSGKDSGSIGECWDKRASGDGVFEIFIRPDCNESIRALFVLAHELTHAAVGLQHGHKGDFAVVALGLGFARPLTHYREPAGALLDWLTAIAAEVGPIPHAALSWRCGITRGSGGVTPREPSGESEAPISSRPKAQVGRLRKCECKECGYTVRVTQKWIDKGLPHCPSHGAMSLEGSQEDGD